MRFGPLIAIIFGFFLISVYPYYTSDDEVPIYIISDDDGDGVPNDKDWCPEEDASERDIDEDGCLDSEITQEDIDYIEKIAKYNLGQYVLFAALSLLGTAIYWEREKIRTALSEDAELYFRKISGEENSASIQENIDYDDLGASKEYNLDTSSFFNRINFSITKLNEEANKGTQLICLIAIICLFSSIGTFGELTWFIVEGNKTNSAWQTENTTHFEVWHYSEKLDYNSNGEMISADYESAICDDELDKSYNCDYRFSLFGTVDTLLSISILFSFFALILSFRSEKYRIGIATLFSIALVTSMASLLIFTGLIDNALITDEHTLDNNQQKAGGCWMSEPIIWGKANCVTLEGDGTHTIESEIDYRPGINFYIILVSSSILFVGLFTEIAPMINMEQVSWAKAIRQNWQAFAIVFIFVFLWRLNVMMSNL